ncbi:Tyrosine-protein phosphatase non-receptor type 9 [Fragariocoptes setiger]|uniref:Tyrosine-protein phosphatase non-receptor type 9 n=1 Tax=Fragariocoptes setiger TaxID=1670756 RepID=A0ABQ7S881_9ACAR|nr:Tyrosine-protein phosphatase non-receptor type 9 [Fragariocoptes setiger]
MASKNEVVDLKTLCDLLKHPDADKYVNIFGIFLREYIMPNVHDRCWVLVDESWEKSNPSDDDGVMIKMCCFLKPLPKVLTGDVVRIHRVRVKYGLLQAECPHPSNVAVWEAFLPVDGEDPPEPKTVAKSVTVEDSDVARVRQLEQWFSCDQLSQIRHDGPSFVKLSGLVVSAQKGHFDHHIVQLVDGSQPNPPLISYYSPEVKPSEPPAIINNSANIRIYARKLPSDSDEHINVARELRPRDLIFVSNLSCRFTPDCRVKFDLSANTLHGKCLRKVHKSSVMGRKIMREVEKLWSTEVGDTGNITSETLIHEQSFNESSDQVRPENLALAIVQAPTTTLTCQKEPSVPSDISDEWLRVKDIGAIVREPRTSGRYCNFFGIFKFMNVLPNGERQWVLTDDSCNQELPVRLCGAHCPYVQAKPGDIVRMHRLFIKYAICECRHPADVTVWDAFKPHKSDEHPPRSAVKKISYTDFDLDRKKELEDSFKCSNIADIDCQTGFIDVAGRVVSATIGDYGHYVIQITDGSHRETEIPCVYDQAIHSLDPGTRCQRNSVIFFRVYRKERERDTDEHIKVAEDLLPGDFIYVSNLRVKNYNGRYAFDLQANLFRGKSLRKIDSGSIFGLKLLCSPHVPVMLGFLNTNSEDNLLSTKSISDPIKNITNSTFCEHYPIIKMESLTPGEEQCLTQFLQIVNRSIRGQHSRNAMCPETAIKFLMARKFDVTRAIQLYKSHEITRLQEGLNDIDPTNEDLNRELNTGKFTILSVRDPQGAAIAIFTARLHSARHRNSFSREANHQITLKGIVYQLDMALDDIQTQRSGVVFIYDMSGSDRSNFEYSFCQKLLNLLKGAYPAKLKKVLIVSVPMWFKAPYQILRLLYPQKLRDRVNLVDRSQLTDHLPLESLPVELGGTYIHNHQAWLNECRRSPMDKFKDLCDKHSAQILLEAPRSIESNNGAIFKERLDRKNSSPAQDSMVRNLLSPEANSGTLTSDHQLSRCNTNEPTYDYCEGGMALKEFINHLKNLGKAGLYEEYRQLRMNDCQGPFWTSQLPINIEKNRYIDVLCLDQTRVILEPDTTSKSDYINANYIDGYKQARGFISTQGPLPNTFVDFWRMIWQTNSRVIVMVTRTFERDTLKCDQYWPIPHDRCLDLSKYVITLEDYSSLGQYNVSQLKLTDTSLDCSRTIWHFQFTAWPDYGVPSSALSLLEFHEQVCEKQKEAVELGSGSKYQPIVVHCSAGIGRSPTFITLDICIKRLDKENLIEVRKVVEKLRQQRALSIQTVDQYIFCHTALLEYALGKGLLQDTDWNSVESGFDETR